MKTILENIAKLFKVKSIITLMLISAITLGFIRGDVTSEVFVSLASSVVTYYFTKNNVSRETTDQQES
ncbi:MAG: hypothetical protein IJ462_01435 [Clostridia bacterium]|nr:hypothetical protein [Clostridia bacterium]